jgi:hypothetical protein
MLNPHTVGLVSKIGEYRRGLTTFSEVTGVGFVLSLDTEARTALLKEIEPRARKRAVVNRTRQLVPALGLDSAKYVLGVRNPKAKVQNAHEDAFNLFWEGMAQSCAGHPEMASLCVAIQEGAISIQFESPLDEIAHDAWIEVEIDGTWALEMPWIRETIRTRDAQQRSPQNKQGFCNICGENGPLIKVAYNALSGSISLTSANNTSGEHHPLKKAFNASICPRCSKGFAEGITYLLKSPRHHTYVGMDAILFFHEKEAAKRVRRTSPVPKALQGLYYLKADDIEESFEERGFHVLHLHKETKRYSLTEYAVDAEAQKRSLRQWAQCMPEEDSKVSLAFILSNHLTTTDSQKSRLEKQLLGIVLGIQPFPPGLLQRVIHRVMHFDKAQNRSTTPLSSQDMGVLLGVLEFYMMRKNMDYETCPAFHLGRALRRLKWCITDSHAKYREVVDRQSRRLSKRPVETIGYVHDRLQYWKDYLSHVPSVEQDFTRFKQLVAEGHREQFNRVDTRAAFLLGYHQEV